ncbi:autotransporter outer membrane beta-barrel domain-containing protein [Stenotrophomonas maltophilia]|nr:autotransporter outer membrane beta-barrel domain-containing protein [Stenotrophomonas maltophilia]
MRSDKQPSPCLHLLTAAILTALICSPTSAKALDPGSVVADGNNKAPSSGEYSSTDDGSGGYVFHALNGGTITATGPFKIAAGGDDTASIRAESAGSITINSAEVRSSGSRSAGVQALDGARIELIKDPIVGEINVITTGVYSPAAQATNASLLIQGTSLRTSGDRSHGLTASGASTVNIQNSTIDAEGLGSYGIHALSGASIDGTGMAIRTSGASAYGVRVDKDATFQLFDSIIHTNGFTSRGVYGSGKILLRNVEVTTFGRDSAAIYADAGGEFEIHGSRLEARPIAGGAGTGIFMGGDAAVTVTDTDIVARDYGINVNRAGNSLILRNVNILTSGPLSYGAGIWMPNASALTMIGGSIAIEGSGGRALDNRASRVVIDGTEITTLGASSHALYASLDTKAGQPLIEARNTTIVTSGEGSIGAVARLGGMAQIEDSSILTNGAKAYGVLSGGIGEMSLTNTSVHATGAAAYAAVVNDGGHLSIDGGSMISDYSAAMWIRSARHVAARGGAMLAGGSGILMHVDAGFASPFEFTMIDGVTARGDIDITPEDIDAGIPDATDVRVALHARSQWTGSSNILRRLEISDQSRWTLTRDSTVEDLAIDNSTIELSAPGSTSFNRLTVNGDFASAASRIVFNGALGSDSSPIDLLHIRGDTWGDADIQVNNVHGLGAQTVDGIRIIQVDGTSNANYSLVGRAVAGQYDYFLHQGGSGSAEDGHWYLRSELNGNPPSPCEDDPEGPGCNPTPDPDPRPSDPDEDTLPPNPCEANDKGDCGTPPGPTVIRPEAGAYLANLRASQSMFELGRGHQSAFRQGAASWVRLDTARDRFAAGAEQISIDGNRQTLTIGSDILRRENGTALGITLATGSANSTSISALTGYYARSKVKGQALGLHGTWRSSGTDDAGNFYIQAAAQRALFQNHVQGTGLAPEKYKSGLWQGIIRSGYTFSLGKDNGDYLDLEPQLQFGYNRWSDMRHVERSGTVVSSGGSNGLFGRVGLRASSRTMRNHSVLVQPFLSVHWLQEDSLPQIRMDDSRVDAHIPRGRAELSAGATLLIRSDWQIRASVSRQQAGSFHETHGELSASFSW